MSVVPEDYIHLNRSALAQLTPRERLAVLAELAVIAPKWLRHERGVEVNRLREQFGDDNAVAKHVGYSRQVLNGLGDGPGVDTADNKRSHPHLLQRGAELLAEYCSLSSTHLDTARQVLSQGRITGDQAQAAAHHLSVAIRELTIDDLVLPSVEHRILQRAVDHVTELTTP